MGVARGLAYVQCRARYDCSFLRSFWSMSVILFIFASMASSFWFVCSFDTRSARFVSWNSQVVDALILYLRTKIDFDHFEQICN